MSQEHQNTANDRDNLPQLLLEYLRLRSSNPQLEFSEPPKRLTGGFDAAIFAFRLNNVGPDLAIPLVLRLYQPARPAQQALREAAIQSALAALGYPAPRVKFAEADRSVLGGAFVIMEHLPGRPLASEFERLARERRGIFSVLSSIRHVVRETRAVWDTAQTRLHALDASRFLAQLEGEGLNRNDFLFDASFGRVRSVIQESRVAGFDPALAWLIAHRPIETTSPVICHGDLQPLNLLAENGTLTGVLDWGMAVVADPALDYGAAVAILATVPIAAPWLVRPFIRGMMNRLAQNHARDYFRLHPRENGALRYFAAYNCISQLAWVAVSNRGAYGSVAGVRNLIAQFRAYTGVRLSIVLPA